MIRQARRREIRELTKEYRTILKSKLFKAVILDKSFDNLSEDDKTLLKEKRHPKVKLQADFNMGVLMLQRLKQIEERIRYLKQRRDLYETNK